METLSRPGGPLGPSEGEKKSEGPSGFRTGQVLAVALAHFVHDVYSSFLSPLLPLLITKLTLSLTQAGFLTTIMQLPSLFNAYIGVLADRVRIRPFVVLAPAMTAIPMSMLGLAPSYGVLLLLLFATGIGISMFHVPAPVMMARLSGERKGRAMSIYMTGGELARALGPLAAVGAVSLFGLEGFYPVMIVGILASVWLYFVIPDIPAQKSAGREPVSLLRTWRGLRHVLGPLSAILIARGFMHASMTAFLPTFIEQETGNLWIGGIGLTVFEVCGVAGILAAGSLSDLMGKRRILLASLLCAPVGVFFFATTDGWIRFFMLLVVGFTLLSTTPVMLAMVQEHAGDRPSTANGFLMMISFLARSATVVAVGFAADLAGLRMTYIVSAVIGLVAIPFILMLPAERFDPHT